MLSRIRTLNSVNLEKKNVEEGRIERLSYSHYRMIVYLKMRGTRVPPTHTHTE